MNDPRPAAAARCPAPALRIVEASTPGYPLARIRWQEWARPPALFEPDQPSPAVCAAGSLDLLRPPSVGLICSSRCPGSIALATYRIARAARPTGPVVIGGFHSPMERTVFELLFTRQVRLVVCPGRRLLARSIPLAWSPAIADQRLLVMSPFTGKQRRVDRDLAVVRNAFVAALAGELFVPYARRGGAVERLVDVLLEQGKPVLTLPDPENNGIIGLGARVIVEDAMVEKLRGGEGQETERPGSDAGSLW